MATFTNITPEWATGDIITKERLNNIQNRINQLGQFANGLNFISSTSANTSGSGTYIATTAYVDSKATDLNNKINSLDSSITNSSDIKTIDTLTQTDGKVTGITFKDIGKANNSTYGVVKVGTNLTSNDGIISLVASPSIAGNFTAGGTLSVTGTSTLTGAVTLQNNLSVTGTSTLTGAATLGSNLSVAGTSTLTGAVTLGNNLSIAGTATFNNTLTVTNNQATTLNGTLEVNKTTTLKDDLTHPLGYYTVTIGQETRRYNCPDKTFSGNYKNITLGAMSEGLEDETADILSRSSEITLSGASTTINTLTNTINGITTISNLMANKLIVGNNNNIISNNSLIVGINCEASGDSSFAHGYSAQAKGQFSIASGWDVQANGKYTIALGYMNERDTLFQEWQANTEYAVDDKVCRILADNIPYGYICIEAHTSTAEFESEYWADIPCTSNYALMFGNGYIENNIDYYKNILTLDWDGQLSSNILKAQKKLLITNIGSTESDIIELATTQATISSTPTVLRMLTANGDEYINGNLNASGLMIGQATTVNNTTVYSIAQFTSNEILLKKPLIMEDLSTFNYGIDLSSTTGRKVHLRLSESSDDLIFKLDISASTLLAYDFVTDVYGTIRSMETFIAKQDSVFGTENANSACNVQCTNKCTGTCTGTCTGSCTGQCGNNCKNACGGISMAGRPTTPDEDDIPHYSGSTTFFVPLTFKKSGEQDIELNYDNVQALLQLISQSGGE